jgi:hypothetical protein
MKRGHKDVRSQPALTELADIFVLSQVNELVCGIQFMSLERTQAIRIGQLSE